jgi:hypothetical protein
VAQKIEVLLVDDLDGGKADETVSFALDGAQFEIDLCHKHAANLRGALEPFVGSGRRTGGRRGARGGARRGRAPGEPTSHEVREWAKAQGIEVSERGRIPSDVLAKFQEARAS